MASASGSLLASVRAFEASEYIKLLSLKLSEEKPHYIKQ